ncbi:subunit of tubulin prefoldin [Gaertneriomyces sp. JEL0708]|nr:Prefoldin-domain-containing protein [Gaertneriomyces semiglobifer]KAJ3176927.1 subunit of tubulin prefoldin [Gaertneriomyces sp. JEL0708]
MTEQPQEQVINPMQIPLQQLRSMHSEIAEEMETLMSSFAHLKTVQAKYNDCLENLTELTPKNLDNEILVPLTTSLYVPGKLSDVEKVIVDVGTGYYIEQAVPDAKNYYTRKVDFLKGNLAKLQETVNDRKSKLDALRDIINLRVAQAQKEQGQAAQKT